MKKFVFSMPMPFSGLSAGAAAAGTKESGRVGRGGGGGHNTRPA
jgi:hypothetical protein